MTTDLTLNAVAWLGVATLSVSAVQAAYRRTGRILAWLRSLWGWLRGRWWL